MKSITIRKPNVIDPEFEVWGGGTYDLKKELEQLGFDWDVKTNHRRWFILYKPKEIMNHQTLDNIDNMIKKIKKYAASKGISVSNDGNNTKIKSKRSRRKSKSKDVDESLMNSNNGYTAGRYIDGKRTNVLHDSLPGDEHEFEGVIRVKEKYNRIEFYGNTSKHKEMLKETFKAQWDSRSSCWYIKPMQSKWTFNSVLIQLNDLDVLHRSNQNDIIQTNSDPDYSVSENESMKDDSENNTQVIHRPITRSQSNNNNTAKLELSDDSDSESENDNNMKQKYGVKTRSQRRKRKPQQHKADRNRQLRHSKRTRPIASFKHGRYEFNCDKNDNVSEFIQQKFNAEYDRMNRVWFADKNQILLGIVNDMLQKSQEDSEESNSRSKSRSRSPRRKRSRRGRYS